MKYEQINDLKKYVKMFNKNIPQNIYIESSVNHLNKKSSNERITNKLNIQNDHNNIILSKGQSKSPQIENKTVRLPVQLQNEQYLYKTAEKKRNKSDNTWKKNEDNKTPNKNVQNTKKIDYRYYSYFPLKKLFPSLDNEKEEEYFWLAVYDKLIKKKKIFKIFSFYNVASRASMVIGNDGIYNDFSKIKEKKMIIKNYELYFKENYNKPFVRKCEEKYIYVKLYLLTLKQINMIFSYLNRIEYKTYINNLGNLIEKDKYKKIANLGDNIYDINYSSIHCLGSYMNRNIYCFSRIENEEIIHNNYSIGVDNYPNSKKIAKLIKLLMINFPDNTKEHFINYIFNDSHNNGLNQKILTDKKNEINHLLISKKKSLYKANSKNDLNMQSIISGIPEFSFSPYFSSNTLNINKTNSNFINNANIVNNNINNNLGTISYNASCFDFTSDFFNSLKQNEETMSKAIDSLRSISNNNQNIKNKTLFNNYASNNNKNLYDDAKISKFSFENDSKNSQNYIKINVSNKNIDRDNNKFKKKGNKNKYKKCNVPKNKVMRVQLRKKNNNYNSNNCSSNNLSSKNGIISKYTNNFSGVTHSILEDNKENNYTISNFDECNKTKNTKKNLTDLTIVKVKKLLNKIRPKIKYNNKTYLDNNTTINKTSLRGEDIFRTTNNRKCKNISLISKKFQNDVRSTDYKYFKENPIYTIKQNFSIYNLNRVPKTNLK